MSKQDTTLDDIGQSITNLGTMISAEIGTVKTEVKTVKTGLGTVKTELETIKKEQTRQGVLLEDLNHKFDKNIDLLSKEMRVKKRVDRHEERLDELEGGQKTIKTVVKLHSKQLAR